MTLTGRVLAARAALDTRLQTPRDAAALVAFRFLFGVVMAASMVRLLAKGWVGALFVEPAFHFPYAAFAWVRPWPGLGMYVHVSVLAAAALGIAFGVAFRLCAVTFFVGFTYLELIDKALYLNHYYLVSLVAGMLMLLPVARAARPSPTWVSYALRAQFGLVYFFAGVAKLNADWLVRAQPLRTWLAASADLPLVGPWLDLPAVAFAASWAGAAFDLFIVPLLLWRRTRVLALATLAIFHVATAALFHIGMFPWIMTVGATLFLPVDWPRRLFPRGYASPTQPTRAAPQRALMVSMVVMGLHLLVQVVLPLRQYLSAGPSAWTGAGFNFAWNVMVAEKSGAVVLTTVERETHRSSIVRPSAYLTPQQESVMSQDADMIAALARHVATELERRGHGPVSVFADARVALNGRPLRPFIDPTLDLATADTIPVLPLVAPNGGRGPVPEGQ